MGRTEATAIPDRRNQPPSLRKTHTLSLGIRVLMLRRKRATRARINLEALKFISTRCERAPRATSSTTDVSRILVCKNL